MTEQPTITRAGIEAATAETERLRLELDITNADHIALWLEENVIPHDALRLCQSWLAVQIVEAHERDLARHRTTSLAAQDGLVEALLPFVDMGHQKGAWGIIQKATGDFEPVTITITKRQMLNLLAALSAIKEQHHD